MTKAHALATFLLVLFLAAVGCDRKPPTAPTAMGHPATAPAAESNRMAAEQGTGPANADAQFDPPSEKQNDPVGGTTKINNAGFLPGNPLQGMPFDASVQQIAMTVEKDQFTPEVVRVPQGTHVILEIESLNATGRLVLRQYGINVKLSPHQNVTAEFYARMPGRSTLSAHN